MIKRIVRLSFQESKADYFLNHILPEQKHFTRNFPGCEHLELWQSIHQKDIIFSYSYWQSEEDLNNYRQSAKFKAFWKESKQYFADKAYAVSVVELEKVEENAKF